MRCSILSTADAICGVQLLANKLLASSFPGTYESLTRYISLGAQCNVLIMHAVITRTPDTLLISDLIVSTLI
jgi:hypothetical protein